MNINDYQRLAMVTKNPDMARDDTLLNAAMGLCGEAGEFCDLIKKWRFHDHPLDREHLKKELGDIAWYIAEAADALGLTLEEVLNANIEKLRARYPEGFDAERSKNRREGDI